MAKKSKTKTDPGMSDAAVWAKTGRTRPHWLKVLNEAGAKRMTHSQIARYLHEEHRKLKDAKAAARMKAHWVQRLGKLKKLLED